MCDFHSYSTGPSLTSGPSALSNSTKITVLVNKQYKVFSVNSFWILFGENKENKFSSTPGIKYASNICCHKVSKRIENFKNKCSNCNDMSSMRYVNKTNQNVEKYFSWALTNFYLNLISLTNL